MYGCNAVVNNYWSLHNALRYLRSGSTKTYLVPQKLDWRVVGEKGCHFLSLIIPRKQIESEGKEIESSDFCFGRWATTTRTKGAVNTDLR